MQTQILLKLKIRNKKSHKQTKHLFYLKNYFLKVIVISKNLRKLGASKKKACTVKKMLVALVA